MSWVESTHIDENGEEVKDVDSDGETIKIPVPAGYTASKIPGETSLNTGFVIYEGDIDWSTILVDETAVETNSLTEEAISEDTNEKDAETAKQVIEETTNTAGETNIASGTNVIEGTTNETNNEESIDDEENIKNQENTTDNTISTQTINVEDETTTENNTTSQEIGIIDETGEMEEEDSTSETINTDSEIDPNTIENSGNSAENEENMIETLADDETDDTDEETSDEITQTDINIFNLQQSTNQYVWVPVNDISRIYGVDANGKLWGKLYSFSSSGRTNLNRTETNGLMSITSKTSYREPDVTHYNTNYDIDSSLQSYFDGKTQYELLSKELEENFYATIKSIQEYGGFYIGRYETGGLNGTAVVRKMDINIGSQTWYTMYEKTSTLGGGKNNVMTSMIWGSLWDETVQWLIDSGATTSDGTTLTYSLVGSNSTTWGNYYNATFNYIPSGSEKPEATEVKAINTSTRIPAGSSDYTKVNNIYDLAGNVWDWTLEANSTVNRVYRGGGYSYYGNDYPATHRNVNYPANYSTNYGCRSVLLIK